jgi:hypothetical protein
MAYFLYLVRRDVVVVAVKDMPWQLEEIAELIGTQIIPSGFVPRIMSELAILQHIAGCRVKG